MTREALDGDDLDARSGDGHHQAAGNGATRNPQETPAQRKPQLTMHRLLLAAVWVTKPLCQQALRAAARCDERAALRQSHHPAFLPQYRNGPSRGLPSDPVFSDQLRLGGQWVTRLENPGLDLFAKLVSYLGVQGCGIETVNMHISDVRHVRYALHMAYVVDDLDKIDV
ncbi:hypothetical protein [Nocardiopsis oceani]